MNYNRNIKVLFLGILLAASANVRASAQICKEGSCVPAQGAYISHFSGPGCTGTESYYLPYDGYAYSCRTWDGGGQCGTIRRTVTNRSYSSNGNCYDAWQSGNTLSDFVTVYRSAGADGDADGLPDSLELSLAQQYFPILNLHCGTFEGMDYADRRQLYGLSVPGYTDSSNGRIPFVAHAYRPGNGSCPEPFQCIELRYGIAWNWDLGDDSGLEKHSGDSEVYAVLLARKDTDGADWGASLDTALNDVNQWRLIKEFMSAHWTAGWPSESSSYRSHGNYGTFNYQRVWCAEGKHAMYRTQSDCNDGGAFYADDCGDNRCDIVDEVFLKVQNVGEQATPLNQVIPYPAYARDVSPSGSYYVWSGDPFGESTDYRKNLTLPLSWCPTQCY